MFALNDFLFAVDPLFVYPAAIVLAVVGLLVGRRKLRRAPVLLAGTALVLIAIGAIFRITKLSFTALLYAGNFWLPVGAFLLILLFGPLLLSLIAFIFALAQRSHTPEALAKAAAIEATPTDAETNASAIAAVIVVWFSPVFGVVLGHIALSQIRSRKQRGRRMALTAVIAGWILVGLSIALSVVVYLIGLGVIAG